MKKNAQILGSVIGWLFLVGGMVLAVAGLGYAGLAAKPQNLRTNQLADVGIGIGVTVAVAGGLVTVTGILLLRAVGRRRSAGTRPSKRSVDE